MIYPFTFLKDPRHDGDLFYLCSQGINISRKDAIAFYSLRSFETLCETIVSFIF